MPRRRKTDTHGPSPPQFPAAVILATALAMAAFAANSIFCRLALKQNLIDAVSFSGIRITSGAVLLSAILLTGPARPRMPLKSTLKMAGMLVTYAVAFSCAYLSLSTGTGALILFGAVQATMIISGLIRGERLNLIQWTGTGLALGGFVCLVLPGLSAPPLAGSLLMALAGTAWGFYSLMGRRTNDPVAATAWNFIWAVPLVSVIQIIAILSNHAKPCHSAPGILYAVLSGALASGAGYVLWYTALRGLSAAKAAVVQLTVPVFAALGGLVFIGEPFSFRLAACGFLILTGVGMVMTARQ